MITFQENTHFSQALPCTKEEFWAQVRKPNTAWRIDARRAIIAAVEASKTQGVAAIQSWLNNGDYQKFLLKKQKLKKKAAIDAWNAKTDAEKLLAFAQEIKDNSVAFIYCCREFDETQTGKGKAFRHRKLADCHLNGLVMLDIDHVENPMQIWYQLRDNQELMARVKLVHITSSSFGIRIIFAANIDDGNLADNQIVFAQVLGQKPDESCIDATRNSFAPKEEDILFIDDTLFDYYNEEFDKRYTQLYREKKTQPLYHEFPSDDKGGRGYGVTQGTGTTVTCEHITDGVQSPCDTCATPANGVKWRGYDVQRIIDARYAAKLPCKDDSNRHNESLKLATDLMLMLDGDKAAVQQVVEAQSWVQEIIAERDENVAQTVESAQGCIAEKEKKFASSLPSKAMLEAVKTATGRSYREIIKEIGGGEGSSQTARIMARLEAWGLEIEKLFDVYPCLREICRGLKPASYPAALFTSAAFLGTDMTRCWWFHYYEPGKERRLNYCVYIIGDPGSGKSFAGRLYKLLAAPIISSDKMSNDAINRYKKELKARQSSTKEQKKEPLKQPEVIVRCHGPRTANGVFIEDMNNALDVVGDKEIHLHMLTFDAELDSNTAAAKGGQWIDKSTMELKAFHNEEDSQQYKNVDSVTGPFDVFWNYVFTGTPMALHKKVTLSNFGSGLSTRLACIPFPPNRKIVECCKYTHTDHEGDEMLKTWAYRLDKVSGELPVWPIVETTWEWTRDHFLISELNEDNADFMLTLRVSYYGVCVAAPFILMRNWEQWEKDRTLPIDDTDRRLSELIMDIQYGCQHYFFGEYARTYYDNKDRDEAANTGNKHSKTRASFNALPETFSLEDVEKAFNTSHEYARVIASRLTKDGNVKRLSKAKYQKVVMLL